MFSKKWMEPKNRAKQARPERERRMTMVVSIIELFTEDLAI
jgi:hypothetical protein